MNKIPWVIWSFRENVDRWSRFHLFGTYTLMDLADRWWAGAVAALLWEGCDVAWYWWTRREEVKSKYWQYSNLTPDHLQPVYVFMDDIFDRRGFSWMDLALGWVAVLTWIIRTR